MAKLPVKNLSDAIFSPVNKAYKVGGLALAFLSLGSFLMLMAFFSDKKDFSTYFIVVTGFILVISPIVLFYLKDVRPLYSVRRNIEQNKELIDAVQKAALEMTELAYNIQSLVFKNANQVDQLMKIVLPKVKTIPLLKDFVINDKILNTENICSSIVNSTKKAKQIISDVEQALVESDPKSLKKYLDELKDVQAKVEILLHST